MHLSLDLFHVYLQIYIIFPSTFISFGLQTFCWTAVELFELSVIDQFSSFRIQLQILTRLLCSHLLCLILWLIDFWGCLKCTDSQSITDYSLKIRVQKSGAAMHSINVNVWSTFLNYASDFWATKLYAFWNSKTFQPLNFVLKSISRKL